MIKIVARYGLHETNEYGYSILKEKDYKLDKERLKSKRMIRMVLTIIILAKILGLEIII